MATKTTNYNLTKPAYDEDADIAVINANMDIIDAKMKELENAGGGASTWSEVANKPFESIGSGLTVLDGALCSTGGGGSSGNIAVRKDFAYIQDIGVVTNIPVGVNDKIEVEFDYNTYNNDECIFGTTFNNGGNSLHLTLFNNKYYSGDGISEFNFGTATTGKHTYIVNDEDNNCTFDGEVVKTGISLVVSGDYYYTLGCRTSIDKNVYNGKIYRFKVTDKSTNIVKCDFVPIICNNLVLTLDDVEYRKTEQAIFDKITAYKFSNSSWYVGDDTV